MNRKKVREIVGGESYEYVPLGKFIVSAPRVCRGRPTFKYTRIEVAGALDRLGAGHSVDKIVRSYQGRVSRDAIKEAVDLAARALSKQTQHSRFASSQ
jgi:uncharacterized protein (DUF433 family)